MMKGLFSLGSLCKAKRRSSSMDELSEMLTLMIKGLTPWDLYARLSNVPHLRIS